MENNDMHFAGYGDFEVRETTPEEKEKAKKKKSSQSIDRYREKYFEYYDDVKDRTKSREDW